MLSNFRSLVWHGLPARVREFHGQDARATAFRRNPESWQVVDHEVRRPTASRREAHDSGRPGRLPGRAVALKVKCPKRLPEPSSPGAWNAPREKVDGAQAPTWPGSR